MRPKQFKEALLRGQGRCIREVRSNPEKYRSMVLWACSHVIAFDPQCEGCRSVFVYELIRCYEDKAPFLQALTESLRKTKSDGRWKTLYLAEVLSYFANDGEEIAKKALWDKYEALYQALLKKKHRPEGVFPERDDFEGICLVLGREESQMLRIAEDIGKLYRTKDFYDGYDFDWLFASCAECRLSTLKKWTKKSENIAAYLLKQKEAEEKHAAWMEARKQNPADLAGRRLSMWLKKHGDEDAVQAAVKAYQNAQDPDVRAEALDAFWVYPFPEDPAHLMEDAKSDHSRLKAAAWRALENIVHPQVRQFALEQLENDLEAAFPVFLAYSRPEDEALLVHLVTSIPVDFACTTMWHGVFGDVLGMQDRGLKAPKALLYHIYETSYCSCCREYALWDMGKRRLLTDEILEECLLDSNDDIRNYAGKILARRENRRKKYGTL